MSHTAPILQLVTICSGCDHPKWSTNNIIVDLYIYIYIYVCMYIKLMSLLHLICIYIYIYRGAGHIIRISSKS